MHVLEVARPTTLRAAPDWISAQTIASPSSGFLLTLETTRRRRADEVLYEALRAVIIRHPLIRIARAGHVYLLVGSWNSKNVRPPSPLLAPITVRT